MRYNLIIITDNISCTTRLYYLNETNIEDWHKIWNFDFLIKIQYRKFPNFIYNSTNEKNANGRTNNISIMDKLTKMCSMSDIGEIYNYLQRPSSVIWIRLRYSLCNVILFQEISKKLFRKKKKNLFLESTYWRFSNAYPLYNKIKH